MAIPAPEPHPPAQPTASAPALATQALTLGELLEIRQGRPVVRHAGGPEGGVMARVLGTLCGPGQALPTLPCPVMLFLEGGDLLRPVVMGLVHEQLPGKGTLVLDMDRIVLQGHSEVELRCGAASVTMRADGRVVVKGSELVSKASATNKIRGASVQIN
jgi:Domain of unknown function (DUF6484)